MNESVQKPGTVRLYHGTTEDAARLICREGFRPLDKEALVESMARAHGLTKIELLRAAQYSFLDSLGRSGEDFVSFKHTAFDVEFWARIGGEARWELLKAVYVHNHPGAGIEDVATTEWAESPANITHVPTVLFVDVPYDLYRESAGTLKTYEEWMQQPDWIRLTGIVELKLPIPVELVAGSAPIDRVLGTHDVAQALGITTSEVNERVERGDLPAADGPIAFNPQWWRSTIAPFIP